LRPLVWAKTQAASTRTQRFQVQAGPALTRRGLARTPSVGTATRPYRAGLSGETALDILTRDRDSTLDDATIDALAERVGRIGRGAP
jgi:hypothetical protein